MGVITVRPRPHPSTYCLGKEFSSNDMGDGPPKKKVAATQNPRALINAFFTPRPTAAAPPRLVTQPTSTTNDTTWATHNHIHALTPRQGTDTIVASSDIAIAMSPQHMTLLQRRLTANPLTTLTLPLVLTTMSGLDVRIAVRRDPVQYTRTPMNGFCTTCVLDAVCRRTTPSPFDTPGLRQHIIESLTTIQTAAESKLFHLTAAAMSNYVRILRTTHSTALGAVDWMNDCHMMAAGRLVSPSFQTWTESEHSVFPHKWMQLNAMAGDSEFQGPSSTQPENLPLLFAEHTPHCGYAERHHFMLLFDNADLLRQLTWLLIGLADFPSVSTTDHPEQQLSSPAPPPHNYTMAPPRRGDPISLRLGSISLHITAHNYNRLYNSTALTPVEDMPAVIRFFLNSADQAGYIGCSTLPNATDADATPGDGFCAYHSIWALDHPGQPRPPAKNRRYLSTTVATICNDHPSPEGHTSTAQERLLQQARLPRAYWPPLSSVAQWANQHETTCIWAAVENLPLPWLELAGIPSTPGDTWSPSATWTVPQLRRLTSIKRHLALDGEHYFPTHPQQIDWDHITETFCLHVSDSLIEHREKRRGQVPEMQDRLCTVTNNNLKKSAPRRPKNSFAKPKSSNTHIDQHATPSAPAPSDTLKSSPLSPTLGQSTAHSPRNCLPPAATTPCRVRFATPINDNNTALHPLPLIHPAMCTFQPPIHALPQPSHRTTLPRRSKVGTQHIRRTFSPGSELYILESQRGNQHDLIVLAPSPFAGSRWAAFARTHSQFGDIIGKYTAHRGGRPSCTHISDPTSSTGEYTMERPYRGDTIRIDPWLFDTCHARFVEEAPTCEQVNVDWEVRDGSIYLINVATRGDIEEGDLYLTNYGEEHWCRDCFPYQLLQQMYQKYAPTMKRHRRDIWTTLLSRVARTTDEQRRMTRQSILRHGLPLPSSTITLQSSPPSTHHTPREACTRTMGQNPAHHEHTTWIRRQHRRGAMKMTHRRQVVEGSVPAKRVTPPPQCELEAYDPPDADNMIRTSPSTPSMQAMLAKQLFQPDWTYTSLTPLMAERKSSLTIMHWPCRGRLYCPGQYISNEVRHTLHFITRLMRERTVGIMWISDAHITKGMLDPYIRDIQADLPDCRVLQFPTTRIATSSSCKNLECMGGAVAIITAQWKGFITTTYTDPIGIGIINAVRFKINNHCFSSACHYFPPSPPGTGPATIHTRITKFQNTPRAPTWARRMSSHEYVRAIAQAQQTRDIEDGHTRFTCGDYNSDTRGTTAAPTTLRAWLNTCTLIDPAATTKHQLPGHHTRQANSETQADSTLDHHFHSPLSTAMSITQQGTLNHPDTWLRSDHLPTWITLAFTTFIPTVSMRGRKINVSRCDIDLQNQIELEQYQMVLDQMITKLPPKYKRLSEAGLATTSPQQSGRCIAAILRMSVAAVESPQGLDKAKKKRLQLGCQRQRSKFKDGYSTTQQLLHCYGTFYRCVIRKVFSTTKNAHTKHIWSPATAHRLLRVWAEQWKEKYCLLLQNATLPPLAADLPHPLTLMTAPFASITLQAMRALIKQTHAHLHGADRYRMRLLSNKEIQKREALRLQGKHGRLIELLTNGGTNMDLDLTTIPCPHTGQITDPAAVHAHISAFFTDWYTIPTTLDPAGSQLAHNMEWARSLLEYHDTGIPQTLHPQSKIPIHMQDGIRRTCAIKVTQQVRDQLRDTTNQPLTFKEFDDAINQIRAGSAPGPSDATANMVKGWTPHTRKLIYAHMTTLWMHKFTPLWMKDKVVKLVPKVPGSSELNNMRPISLYEVVRKVWTTTIARRIHLVWHTNNVLNPAQHGYRLDQGTHMALIRVLDIIEGAHNNNTPTAITFWDIRRAFDSIPRTLQQLAWERLGVPQSIAEWFVKMDDGGLSFLATPHYHTSRSLKTPPVLLRSDGHFSNDPRLAISPERGVGQGESASSLMWTAVYDLLLDWIDPCNMQLHHYEHKALQIKFTKEDAALARAAAYADDLTTAGRGPRAIIVQQRVTTWISAFGAFSSLELHPAKIVSTTINSPSLHKLTTLTVRDHQWNPIHVTIDHHLATHKYLGIQLNFQGDYRSSLQIVVADAQTRLQHLLVQPASPQAKILYIRNKIAPIILYSACCMDWPLAAYKELDIPFIHAYRRILSLPERTPREIYHLPTALCGIGLPCMADMAQIRKWNVIQRCQAVGGDTEHSINDMFARIPDGLTQFDEYNHSAQLSREKWPNRPTFMVRSLIEWLAQSNLCCTQRNDHHSPHREGQLLSTLAKDLALQFDDELYLREDFEYFPLTSVTTDGSFKVTASTRADLLQPYSHLQDKAAGGGGIILTADSTHHHNIPLGIHISMDMPERGMNAYIWELLTQLVALHLIKEYSRKIPFQSDCCSAIARTNHALASYNDTLVSTKAGLLPSCMNLFSCTHDPRILTHVPAHPENNEERRTHPSPQDKAIFLADAVADGHNRSGEACLGTHRLQYRPYTLTLRHIYNELIPTGLWHIRHCSDTRSPVLGSLLSYQHTTKLNNYTAKRDAASGNNYWSSTSFAFANILHPPVCDTPWQQARRATHFFDKLGHGGNRAKLRSLTPEQAAHTAKCTYCKAPDSQEHCMIACPHPAFAPIRKKACDKQHMIATALRTEFASCPKLKALIDNICHYSWHADSMHIKRLWLGMWTIELLGALSAPYHTDESASMADIASASKIATALTTPLLSAHRQITLHITAWPRSRTITPPEILAPTDPTEPLPLLDHIPADQHLGATDQHTSDALRVGDTSSAVERHYRDLAHIIHIQTTSDILPATPPDNQCTPHCPYACADDAMQIPDMMHPEDARKFDS